MRMNLLAGMAAGVLMAISAAGAHATQLFHFTYASSGSPSAADLYLTTSDALNAFGAFDITSVTGNVDLDNVSLAPDPEGATPFSVSADGLFYFDNDYHPGLPHLTNAGLLVRSLTFEYNVFATTQGLPTTTFEIYKATLGDGATYVANSVGDARFDAVPEPTSWALMLVGFGGLGAMLRKRRAYTAFAA